MTSEGSHSLTPEEEKEIRADLTRGRLMFPAGDVHELLAEIDSLREKCAKMQEWLELDGQHTMKCAVHDRKAVTGLEPWPDCTCGLSNLLEDA